MKIKGVAFNLSGLKAVLLTLTPVMALADWSTNSYVDEMTDVETRGAYSNRGVGAHVGIECLSKDGKPGEIRFDFGTGETFATPSSAVSIKLRIDKNTPFDLNGQMYSNSYKAGYSYMQELDTDSATELLAQLAAGGGYIVRYQKYGKTLTQRGSLRQSRAHLLKVIDDCQYGHFGALAEKLKLKGEEYRASSQAAKLPAKRSPTPEQIANSESAAAAIREARANAVDAAKMAAEASRREEIRQLKLDQRRYLQSIVHRVKRAWIKPPSVSNFSCQVQARQIPGGEIIAVEVLECTGGGPELARSVERAVLKASPLPPAPDPRLFNRVVEFKFAS